MKGCGDHGCLVAKPQGMGTNAGCRCPVWKLHAVIGRQRDALRKVEDAVRVALVPQREEDE